MIEHSFTPEEWEQLVYASRDGQRLYRRIRRDVNEGLIDHYTVEKCTDKIKEYRILEKKLMEVYW